MTTHAPTAATITGIDIAVHSISDAGRAIAFYRDVLGMPVSDEYEGRGAEFELADGSTFGVWKPDAGQPEKGVTLMFAVADMTSALETFRARGAELHGPEETPACFMAFGADPDGNAFIIHERKTGA